MNKLSVKILKTRDHNNKIVKEDMLPSYISFFMSTHNGKLLLLLYKMHDHENRMFIKTGTYEKIYDKHGVFNKDLKIVRTENDMKNIFGMNSFGWLVGLKNKITIVKYSDGLPVEISLQIIKEK